PYATNGPTRDRDRVRWRADHTPTRTTTAIPVGACGASRTARPAVERPSDPVTATTSPTRAVDLRMGRAIASPSNVTLTIQPRGEAHVSPPTTTTSSSAASAWRPP